ncbi:MAG: C40 family peptidase [Methylovulum sp.]|nr:C40 family peptidase [Methylovulum sp.]
MNKAQKAGGSGFLSIYVMHVMKKSLLFFSMQRQLWVRLFLVLATMLVASCASTPEIKPVARSVAAQPRLVSYALSLQGAPYRYGKETPEEGFDCSGFVRHVYKKQGITLPRTAKDMALALSPIPKNAVHSGDLLFFNIDGRPFSHVGIYVNNDSFIHAPSQRTGRVLVSSLKNDYWHKRYIGARRP